MPILKITKKHHKRFNNPFPSSPTSLPFIHGSLFADPKTLPPSQTFPLGSHFHLQWSSINGGSFTIRHRSRPSKPLWSTLPGLAFVSAASVNTEIEESRGSFAVKDSSVRSLCDHQTVQSIRVLDRSAMEISGWVLSINVKESNVCAKYSVLFDQRSENQVGFRVEFGDLNHEFSPRASGVFWSFGRAKKVVVVSPSSPSEAASESEGGRECEKFNRVWLTYSSEENERFFGFGEQFSHMDFKGKRVPILVQEQGIGRGDQPITFAANLVSYRYIQ